MNIQLDNRVCLITGASRGIGRAIAMALGESLSGDAGAIIGTATTQAGADGITQAFAEAGIRGGGRVLDVTDGAAVDELIAGITSEFGAPTVLVNNAGITRDQLLLRMREDDWDAVQDANLKSVYRLCKAALRGMTRAKYGRIINIASVVAAAGNAGQSNYAAAKAGMVGFSKSLAREVAARNITVNVVAPGFIATDMTAALPEAQRISLLAQIPLGRLGAAEDIAAAVLYLASDGAGYVTGATLHVNGGMYM